MAHTNARGRTSDSPSTEPYDITGGFTIELVGLLLAHTDGDSDTQIALIRELATRWGYDPDALVQNLPDFLELCSVVDIAMRDLSKEWSGDPSILLLDLAHLFGRCARENRQLSEVAEKWNAAERPLHPADLTEVQDD